MAAKQLRERLALLGGTALLALAIFGAIARRTFARRRPAGHEAPDPPPAGTLPPGA